MNLYWQYNTRDYDFILYASYARYMMYNMYIRPIELSYRE